MISFKDELDLEGEIYRLNGVKNLLNAWSNEHGGFELSYITNALNDVVEEISKILDINLDE